MFTLHLIPEPTWIDMPFKVRLLVDPPSALMMDAVRDELLEDAEPAATAEDDAEPEDAGHQPSPRKRDLPVGAHAWVSRVAPRVVRDWRGVADKDGNTIAANADTIAALMRDDRMCQAFWRRYVLPVLNAADAEKSEGNG